MDESQIVSKVRVAYGEDETRTITQELIADGYYEQDEDAGICFGGVFVGRVFAKFTWWNEAYDFVILSIFPD